MRQELIEQTQEMAASATAALDTILALRAQLLEEIDIALDYPSKPDQINELDKQLTDLNMAINHVRIYLLGFHLTLTSVQSDLSFFRYNVPNPHLPLSLHHHCPVRFADK